MSLDGLKSVDPIVQSIDKETGIPISTRVSGSIPTWIAGSILRNGSGQWDINGESVNHWFDGHALIHKFEINNGEVTYMNKFLRSECYEKNTKYGRWILGGFGTPVRYADPCKTLFERFTSLFTPKPQTYDNCNVNIWPVGDKLYAFTETTTIREVDPETLNSPNKEEISNYITVNLTTAHPHTDKNGVFYNMGTTFGKNTMYNVIKCDPKKNSGGLENIEIIASIPADNSRESAYYHSYSMTTNHVLFLEMPYRFNLFTMLASKFTGSPPAAALEFREEYNSIFKIANIHTGQTLPIRLETKGMGCFHFGNAFEVEINGIVFAVWDTCPNYEAKGATHLFTIETLRTRSEADLKKAFKQAGENVAKRFVFPLSVPSGTKAGENINQLLNGVFETDAKATLLENGTIWLEGEKLFDNSDLKAGFFGFEFPRYNYALNGMKYRYLYGCGFGQILPDRLCKVDTQTKTVKIWSEENIFPSEPVFVQNPSSTDISGIDEDAGVVLSICVSTKKDIPIFLLILDAKSFEEIGRATTDITGMPYGFHHTFLPSSFGK